MLAKNWALTITDYEGLGMPGNHTYVIAPSEAHAVLPAMGLDTAYPELHLEKHLNDLGKSVFLPIEEGTKSGCDLDLILAFGFGTTSQYTTSDPMKQPDWQKRIEENKLACARRHGPVGAVPARRAYLR